MEKTGSGHESSGKTQTHRGRSHESGWHPTALIDSRAQIAADVEIGPYAIIEGDVSIGAGCKVGPYTHIKGFTTIGEGNRFFQGCVIGEDPQSISFKNPKAMLTIGDHNTFREFCTIHSSTYEGIPTRIGSRNYLMANCHVAHDCILGDNIVFSNNTGLSGHVTIENNVFISGHTGVHQFCKIGTFAMIGGVSKVVKDVLPYSMTEGNPAYVVGLNRIGMKRNGITGALSRAVKDAYKIMYRSDLLVSDAFHEIKTNLIPSIEDPQARELIVRYAAFGENLKLGVMPAGTQI